MADHFTTEDIAKAVRQLEHHDIYRLFKHPEQQRVFTEQDVFRAASAEFFLDLATMVGMDDPFAIFQPYRVVLNFGPRPRNIHPSAWARWVMEFVFWLQDHAPSHIKWRAQFDGEKTNQKEYTNDPRP